MKHTPDCQARMARYTAWITRWPHYCKTCNAIGVIHDPGYWDARAGEGLPPNDEPCENCVASIDSDTTSVLGCCPRCVGIFDVANLLVDSKNATECPHCGWANGIGTDDHCPEVDCYCGEV